MSQRKILEWIPPTSNLHVGHKIKFPILWGIDYVTWRKILKWIPPTFFMWDTK